MRGFLALLCCLALARHGSCFTIDSATKSASSTVMDLLLSCRFDTSFALLDSLEEADEEDALWPLLRLSGIILKELDHDSVDEPAAAGATFERVRAGAAAALQRGDSSYGYTMEGLAGGAYAAGLLRRGRYAPGVRQGLAALDMLRTAEEIDPDNADAGLLLGMYNCGKAELRRRFRWILFWYPGTIDKGIRQLRDCRQSAQVASTAAGYALAEIYIREERFGEASALLDTLRTRHPSGRFLIWTEARYFSATEDFDAAAAMYRRLHRMYRRIPRARRSAAATLYHTADCLCRGGKSEQAVEACRRLLAAYPPADDPRMREIVRDTHSLLKEARDNACD